MYVHWKINGISACRSPLAQAIHPTPSCGYAGRRDPELLDALSKFHAVWGFADNIAAIDGPCDQRDLASHDEESPAIYDRYQLPPKLLPEYDRQLVRLVKHMLSPSDFARIKVDYRFALPKNANIRRSQKR